MIKKKSYSWGNYPKTNSNYFDFTSDQAFPGLKKDIIPFGNGRSYGDSCINKNIVSFVCNKKPSPNTAKVA